MTDLTELLSDIKTYADLDPINYEYFNQRINRRAILLNSEVDDAIVEMVMLPLLNFEADDSNEKVTLYINSCGGSVLVSLPLVNILNNYKKKLDIIVFGCALSMGAIFLAIDNPNVTRKCYSFSNFLMHSGDSSFCGDTNAVKDTMKYYESLDKKIKDFIIAKTKITPEQFEDNSRKQWWISAQEAVEIGLIDEIIC